MWVMISICLHSDSEFNLKWNKKNRRIEYNSIFSQGPIQYLSDSGWLVSIGRPIRRFRIETGSKQDIHKTT